jgi:transposase-like protein
MPRNRANKAELIKRREEIQQLIVQGMTNYDILESMSIKWKTSKRAIQDDISTIAKEWQKREPEETALMRNKYADRLEYMFNEAMSKGHVKVALEVQKEIHKLNGMYVGEKEDANTMPEIINISKKPKLRAVEG